MGELKFSGVCRSALALVVSFSMIVGLCPLAYADTGSTTDPESREAESSLDDSRDLGSSGGSQDGVSDSIEDEEETPVDGDLLNSSGQDLQKDTAPLGSVESTSGEEDADDLDEPQQVSARLTACAHVQTYGWLSIVSPELGEACSIGTTGQSKRMEAVQLSVDVDGPEGYTGGIEYRSHVQRIGWQDWKSDGDLSGTTGMSRRLESLQIRLTGDLAKDYDVYYRVHVQHLGWLGWAKNGDCAGTASFSKRLESIEIILQAKDAAAPSSEGGAFFDSSSAMVSYDAYGAGSSWKNAFMGKTVGTTSDSAAPLTGMRINNLGTASGDIYYSAHLAHVGWTAASPSGTSVGTLDSYNGIQAIKISLSGDLARHFDVYYRVRVPYYGWMGWACNGQPAGTEGLSVDITAYQVVLVVNGKSAPGSTSKHYSDSTGFLKGWKHVGSFVKKANGLSSSTKWLVLVDTTLNHTAIFYGSKGNWELEKFWICTTGHVTQPTVKGTFKVGSKGLHFGEAKGYTCWYYTQFYGNYLFHSVLYQPYSKTSIKDGRLGIKASAGCVRLEIENAEWLYDNIPRGTKVVVY